MSLFCQMNHAEQIAELLEREPETAAFTLPVFFVGARGVRQIGHATHIGGVDALLFCHRLSAHSISKAQLARGGRFFFIAHG